MPDTGEYGKPSRIISKEETEHAEKESQTRADQQMQSEEKGLRQRVKESVEKVKARLQPELDVAEVKHRHEYEESERRGTSAKAFRESTKQNANKEPYKPHPMFGESVKEYAISRVKESSKDWNPFGGLQEGRERRRETREGPAGRTWFDSTHYSELGSTKIKTGKKPYGGFWNPAPRKSGGKSGGKSSGMMGVGFLFPPAARKPRKGHKKKRGGNGGSSDEMFGMGGTDGWLL